MVTSDISADLLLVIKMAMSDMAKAIIGVLLWLNITPANRTMPAITYGVLFFSC
ncbi:putative retrotransposon Tca2 polyprotein [Edwardsiella piscicida]|nr:putative retrotransposon Tca2 polyprotein [Edwardsiella piscicida]